MAIKRLTTTRDAVGFPVVEWTETRRNGSARVKCFITRDPATDALLFATSGSLSTNGLYTQRPWEKLVGFRPTPARELYYTAADHRMNEALRSIASQKFKTAALFITDDDSIVMLADIADECPSIPMHLNYALGTAVEIAELHSELYRCFIAQRQALVESLCDGEYKWPAGKQHVASIPASRSGSSAMPNDTPFKIIAAIACGLLAVYFQPASMRGSPQFTFDNGVLVFMFGAFVGVVGAAIISTLVTLLQTHGRQIGAGIMLFFIIAGGLLNANTAHSTNDAVGLFILGGFVGAFLGAIATAILGFVAGLISDLLGR